MGAITSSFIFDVESRWRQIVENTYGALLAAENQWWSNITKVIPSGSRRDILTWVLATALLERKGRLGGEIGFQDMVMMETDFTSEFANAGLQLLKSQFEDLDGNGIELGTAWINQVTAQSAYWPQKQVAALLKSTTALAYDGLTFFNANHLLNPKDAAVGTYPNLITSVPVDTSVTLDKAIENLQTVFSTIAAIKMPNGEDPRFLMPGEILCGPLLYPRLLQIVRAQFIASGATSGSTAVGGTSDLAGIIQAMGYGKVTLVPELAGWGSDTTYFVTTEAAGVPRSDLAGFVYVERVPFGVTYYSGAGSAYVDAILDRSNTLEWHCQGRNIAGYGHPYGVVKCTA